MSTDFSHVRLGTSSWAYEGWQGMVYHRTYPKSRFSQDTLTEYAGYELDGIPLFRTVGIDHSFYRPASAAQLAHYARQVPVGSGGVCNNGAPTAIGIRSISGSRF